MDLKGKTAIVTGATKGLGEAISMALIEKSAIVYGLGRDQKALEKIERKAGQHFHAVKLDISVEEDVKKWFTQEFEGKAGPDILINNAGVGSFAKIEETATGDWLKMINTNINGLFFMTQNAVSFMKIKSNHCHIINIGSILGTVGRAESSGYCATKFGVRGFSESIFLELRKYNIKVTCVNPGSIETNFFKDSGVEAHHNMLQTSDIADTIIHILETPDNMLIDEITIRPLNPKAPSS